MKLSALATGIALLLTHSSCSTVQRGLLESLENGKTKDIVVTFDGTKDVLSSTMFPASASRQQRAQTVLHVLEDKAAVTQYTTVDLLKNFDNIEVTSLWISNTLHIKGATSEVVKVLASHNGANHVREAVVINLEEPRESSTAPPTVMGNEWGVAKVQAPQVWAQGITGRNIVVAGIDTGVRGTHEALKDNFRKYNGWYDPYESTTTPNDAQGHGTHTMGTICGKNGIGVAPDAQWIACRGCNTRSCTEVGLLKCAQYATCPHDASGRNPNCSAAPHIVSNSWGGGRGDFFYKAATDAWTAAGIIPVFANGNDGPYCDTASSPGDYTNVIAVGSTTSDDSISSFSSKGPAAQANIIKPDISAPGSDVRSAYKNSDTSYSILSGTSMATPHVSGVVALLLSYTGAGLSYQEVYQRLTSTAERNLVVGQICRSEDSSFPNNIFGHGRINAFKAVYSGAPGPTSSVPFPTTTQPTPPKPTTTQPTPPKPTTTQPTPPKPTTTQPTPPKPTTTPTPSTSRPNPLKCEFSWTGLIPECIPGDFCEMNWNKLECNPKRF